MFSGSTSERHDPTGAERTSTCAAQRGRRAAEPSARNRVVNRQERVELTAVVRDERPRSDLFVVDVTTSAETIGDLLAEIVVRVPDVEIHDVRDDGFSYTATLPEAVTAFRRMAQAADDIARPRRIGERLGGASCDVRRSGRRPRGANGR